MADQLVERADRRAAGPHPLADPNFPFPVRVIVDGKVRPMVRRGNDMLVPLRAGEVYAVDIENRTNQPIKMRMLVDGLDTLPHTLTVKGIQTETWAAGDSERGACLAPEPADLPGERLHHQDRAGRRDPRFTVAHLEKASAARQEFTDQIGLITLAFYDMPGGSARATVHRSRGRVRPAAARARVRGGRQPAGRGPPALRRRRRP